MSTRKSKVQSPKSKGEPVLYKWQWHGRVVTHVADICEAPDEKTARVMFRKMYPEARTYGFFRIGPVEPKRKSRRKA